MSSATKFSREDDQLLALNYENLCDADYVGRLFSSDAQMSSSSPRAAQAVLNDWLLTPDIAEDVLLFGDSPRIGLGFLSRRVRSCDPSAAPRVLEPATATILKQVQIFSHIGDLVRDRCHVSVTKRGANSSKDAIDRIGLASMTDSLSRGGTALVPDALTCALAVLEKKSQNKLPTKAIDFMLSAVIESLQHARAASLLNPLHPVVSFSSRQAQSLRVMLCNGARAGLADVAAAMEAGDAPDSVQGTLRLVAACIYGLLSVGLLAHCPGDILIATVQLMATHSLLVELRTRIADPLVAPGSIEQSPAIECQEKLRMRNKIIENNKVALKQPPIIVTDSRDEADSRTSHPLIPMKVRDSAGSKKDPSQKVKMSLQMKSRPGSDAYRDVEDSSSSSGSIVPLISKQRGSNAATAQPPTVAMSMPLTEVQHDPHYSPLGMQQSKSIPMLTKKALQQQKPKVTATSNNADERYLWNGDLSPSANQMPHDSEQIPSKKRECTLSDVLNVPSGLLNSLTDGLNNAATNFKPNFKNRNKLPCDSKTEIWTCGQNSYGELGHGDVNIRKSFAKISFFESKSIIGAGAGNEHSVFLSSLGKVYVSGYNDNGQCGLGTTQQVRQPTLIASLEAEDIARVHVYNGSEHTLLVTRDGRLYAFGYNYRGQLGLGTTTSEVVPRLVKGLLSKKVRVAACSYHHSTVVCSDGSLFTFGRNDCGQLGHGDCTDRKTPQLVPNIFKPVVSVSCGQFHTAFVNSSGQAMVCGKNDFGQLALENVEHSKVFCPIEGIPASDLSSVSSVCCGYYHTLIIVQSGIVYGCGRNDYGQLGLGHTQPRVHRLQSVDGLREKLVNSLSCGCYHSIAITSNGMLYVFGRNNHGQLGTGDNDERHSPHPVDNFVGRKILTVSAGFYHSLVLAGECGAMSDEAGDDMLDDANEIGTGPLPASAAAEYNARLNAIHDSTVRNEATVDRRLPSPSLSYFSSKDYPSTTSIADVLKLLIGYMKNIPDQEHMYTAPDEMADELNKGVQKSHGPLPDLRDRLSWVSQQYRCLAALMQLIRRSVSPIDSPGVDLPYSEDEAMALLGNIVHIVEQLLSNSRTFMGVVFATLDVRAVEDSENFSESLFAQDMCSVITPVSVVSVIFNASAVASSVDVPKLRDGLIADLSWLRRELLLVYFFLPVLGEHTGSISQKAFSCLSKNSRLFFWSTKSFSSVLTFLAKHLQGVEQIEYVETLSSSMGRYIDYAMCFRLFTRLCIGFRDIREVVKLFQSSLQEGLIICQQLVNVHCVVSMRCLAKKESESGDATIHPSSETSVRIGMLEYCCANFVKCALPIILAEDSHCTSEVGYNMLKRILETAVDVISIISTRQLGEEALNYLRFGTVLPNIVPTVILFGIANSSSVGTISHIFPFVNTLTNELKKLSDSDTRISNSFLISQNRFPAAANMTTDTVGSTDLNDQVATEDFVQNSRSTDSGAAHPPTVGSVQGKKDSQLLWWSRLLRLCAIFSSKIGSQLMIEDVPSVLLKYTRRSEVAESILVVSASDIASLNGRAVSSSMATGPLWSYLEGITELKLQNFLSDKKAQEIASADIDKICTQLRTSEYKKNTNYRFTTSRDTPANSLIRFIECEIFRVVYYVEKPFFDLLKRAGCSLTDSQVYCYSRFFNLWHQIAALMGSMSTYRTVLLSNTELSWEEVLGHILSVMRRWSSLLLTCPRRWSISPLLAPNRKVHPALRRTFFVVLSAVRWRSCRRHQFRESNQAVVRMANSVLDTVFLKRTDAVPLTSDIIEEKWSMVLKSLQASHNIVSNRLAGTEMLCDILSEPMLAAMRGDIIVMLMDAWKTSVASKSTSKNSVSGDVSFQNAFRGNDHMLVKQKKVSRRLVNIFTGMLVDLCCSSPRVQVLDKRDIPKILISDTVGQNGNMPITDITTLTLVCKALEYITATYESMFSLLGRDLHSFIWQVYAITSSCIAKLRDVSSSEDKPSAQVKRVAAKERVSLCRRCIYTCVGLIQQLCTKSVELRLQCTESTQLFLIDVSARLIAQLQRAVLMAPTSGADATGQAEKDLKTGISHLTGGDGSKGVTAAASAASAAAAQKKRCQELISQPMSFSKGQEGFVVQGDKLLSNFRGVDFTISTWIYVTKKEAGKHYFITGKVSHNDAWPILVLRGVDGKIDIAYGRTNEFDRLTTVAAIAVNCWTHIAVVCDPRKFKVFINGQLDCQTNTVGNARAILYPLVIGSCPLAVRTRVEHVRDGFEGYLSCYKYHTRAMSPIHARVVFDQGPPELFDSKERWIYQLTAAAGVLISSFSSLRGDELLNCAELQLLSSVMQSLFVSESNRVREASVQLLMKIFALNCCQDIYLSPHSLYQGGATILTATVHSSASSPSEGKMDDTASPVVSGLSENTVTLPVVPQTPLSMMSAPFLSEGSGFHEKFVLYYLRIMGMCWTTTTSSNNAESGASYTNKDSFSAVGFSGAGNASNNSKSSTNSAKTSAGLPDSKCAELAKFSPKFVGIFSNGTSSGSAVSSPNLFTLDKVVSRDKIVGTLCHSLANALRSLIATNCDNNKSDGKKQWYDAVNSVLYRCLCRCRLAISVRSEWTPNLVVDIMGCAALLGIIPPGQPYPGCEVDCFYGTSRGRVLNVDTSSQLATLLMIGKRQLLSARVADVAVCQTPSSSATLHLADFVNQAVLDLMDSLKSFMWPLVSDMLCTFHPEHPFIRQVLLKAVRPVETAIFYQMLRYVVNNFSNMRSSDIISRNELFMTFVQFCARNEQISLDSIQLRLSSSRCFVSDSWAKAGTFVSSVPEKLVHAEFPSSPEGDKCFADYSNKNLGIVVDTLPNQISSKMLKNGMLSELIYLLSGSSDAGFHVGREHQELTVCPESFPLSEYSNSRTASGGLPHSYSSSTKGANVGQELSDSDTLAALRLFYNLRSGILRHSQRLITVVLNTSGVFFESMSLYWKTVLWHSLSSKNIIHTSPEVSPLADNLCRALSREHPTESVSFLANCLRYASVSLFHMNFSRASHGRNILEHTDVYERLLKAAQSWILINGVGSVAGIDMCLQLLKILLPALAFIESGSVELRVIQLCQLAVHGLMMTVMDFRSGTSSISYEVFLLKGGEIYEMSRGNSFALLWSSAHEQLVKERGLASSQLSAKSQLLVHMAVSLVTIQRLFRPACAGNPMQTPPPRKSAPKGISSIEELSFIPPPPRGLDMCSTLVEIDLRETVSGAKKWCQQVAAANGNDDTVHDGDNFDRATLSVEVQLKLHSDVEDNEYETIFYGTARRFVHGGLAAGTKYDIRCRCVSTANLAGNNSGSCGIESEWSSTAAFTTLSSIIPFSFDQCSCGPDIILSDNGLVASYTGDDSWSTVLGTQGFVHGINSWEVRVTASSTAYLFIGIATSKADLNTFLGGCKHGWGFIGEQALYHNREKVKIYGEPFMAGDVVGVTLNLINGTLSFTRNGKILGVAFDKLYGEFYPAVAFYNVGQEVEIVSDTAVSASSCLHEPIPCSPSRINLDEVSLLLEAVYSMSTASPMSNRLLDAVAQHTSAWCSGNTSRHNSRSGRKIMVRSDSPLLLIQGFKVGEKVRTPYGVATVAGVAFSRIWFKHTESGDIWFFSKAQIASGRDSGMFQRCSYNNISLGHNATASNDNAHTTGNDDSAPEYDAASISDLLDPAKWSRDLDNVLVKHLLVSSQKSAISPWAVRSSDAFERYREIQQSLSKYVMRSVGLSHRWGISGPKRRAVVARIGLIRYLNHLAEHNFSALMQIGNGIDTFSCEKVSIADDLYPLFTTIRCVGRDVGDNKRTPTMEQFRPSVAMSYAAKSNWPIISVFWNKRQTKHSANSGKSQSCGVSETLLESVNTENIVLGHAQSPFASLRYYLFSDIKHRHFFDALTKSSFRSAKTDDEYDYPDDLPQVKLNRFRSFRAMEASATLGVPGEDLYLSTMFCQLWRELRAHSVEKLRMSYTHPMDDGQSRAFKVKFEGEGVDDYGGPYREVFQKICEELQAPDNSTTRTSEEIDSKLYSCFIPLLMQTPNWASNSGEVEERYKFIFNPSSSSPLHMDLYTFLGQFVGLAMRSKITIDLPLPSVIWKMVLREPLNVDDIASFDISASLFVLHVGSLYQRYTEHLKGAVQNNATPMLLRSISDAPIPSPLHSLESLDRIRVASNGSGEDVYHPLLEEIQSLIQDLTWTATRSDGKTIELVESGSSKEVTIDNLGDYLSLYVQARLLECAPAVESFRNGFLSVVPENALTLLCWYDLDRLVCGAGAIDVSRLKDNAEYDDDVTPEDPHIVAFWDVLANDFSEEEKVLFLRFVWARPSLPPIGTEFSQKLKIQSAVGEDSDLKPDQYLPKAHTCFFSINLPRYSTKDVLSDRLRYAINNCTEMDADFRLTDTDVAGWTSYFSEQRTFATGLE